MNKIKKQSLLALAAAGLAFGLVACGDDSSSSSSVAPEEESEGVTLTGVVFGSDYKTGELRWIGRRIGKNVEFVQVLSEGRLRMRVWERGSGVTMACGTGACAAVAAAVKKGCCPSDTPIAVMLDGGKLEITVAANGRVTMTGPAETVYEGEATL